MEFPFPEIVTVARLKSVATFWYRKRAWFALSSTVERTTRVWRFLQVFVKRAIDFYHNILSRYVGRGSACGNPADRYSSRVAVLCIPVEPSSGWGLSTFSFANRSITVVCSLSVMWRWRLVVYLAYRYFWLLSLNPRPVHRDDLPGSRTSTLLTICEWPGHHRLRRLHSWWVSSFSRRLSARCFINRCSIS